MKIALVLIDDDGKYHVGTSEDVGELIEMETRGERIGSNWDPFLAARCARGCEAKAGSGACFAACMLTGQACDNGGFDNCTPV